MKSQINLGTVDGRDENVLESIVRLVEIARLNRTISEKTKVEIEDCVLKIENHIQDLNDINQKSSREILKIVLKLLKSFSTALGNEALSKQEVLFLRHFLNEIHLTLNSIKEIGISNFFMIMKKMGTELAFMPTIVIPESHVVSIRNERIKLLKQNKKQLEKESSPLEIEIFLSDKKDSKSLQTLAIFVETFNSIEGSSVVIEDIIKGSIISRLKIYFKSPAAKKQAIELLESTRKFAIGKLEKEHSENEKLKREAEKIDLETQKIADDIAAENSLLSVKKRELELEGLRLDNDKKKLQNQKLALDIFTQNTVLLKQLLSDQLLSQQEFQILIDKHLFIAKVNDTITMGLSISEIENK